ncbi:CBS domain-containing protein [Oerskovia turbata]|uniref:CBS domain-containing protein n=1 Tax=Oerskovia turbata TaxID=1713 RepID=A0A4Q1KYG5_9CELL|nr:CBS domain-containing protein [Oerskovia turbata]RXR24871.1 CBS domain-containing protein [Oerskovia turbata]RXR34925.1 CBS domain-containing protein [Oerskovia turbata]TGJ96981.1 CBS domain-containing protein [Actinotalea fermentans ATCC 43279 = JCM 9966 = DSM 3133]
MPTTIAQLMSTTFCTVERTATVAQAARTMIDDDSGDAVVLDDGDVLGILTDRSIVRALADDASPDHPVGELCTEDLVVLSPQDPAREAVRIMERHALLRLPVMVGPDLVGIVRLSDLVTAIERGQVSVGARDTADLQDA